MLPIFAEIRHLVIAHRWRSAQLDGALARRLCTAGGRVLFTNVLQSVYAQIIDCETCESPARIEVNFMELCAYVIDSFVND